MGAPSRRRWHCIKKLREENSCTSALTPQQTEALKAYSQPQVPARSQPVAWKQGEHRRKDKEQEAGAKEESNILTRLPAGAAAGWQRSHLPPYQHHRGGSMLLMTWQITKPKTGIRRRTPTTTPRSRHQRKRRKLAFMLARKRTTCTAGMRACISRLRRKHLILCLIAPPNALRASARPMAPWRRIRRVQLAEMNRIGVALAATSAIWRRAERARQLARRERMLASFTEGYAAATRDMWQAS